MSAEGAAVEKLVEAKLKVIFRETLGAAAKDQGIGVDVAGVERGVKFGEWPGVGSVDVALNLRGATPRSAFFELNGARARSTTVFETPPKWPSPSPFTPATAPSWSLAPTA